MRKLIVLPLLATTAIMVACGGQVGTPSVPPTAQPATVAVNPTDPPAAQPPGGSRQYQIIPSESEVRFIIDEVLMGQDNTVIGTTHQVAGGFNASMAAPESATFEPIVVDATSFATDENRRDQAIQRFILETATPANATVTFTPTSVEGLPSMVEVGQEYSVSIAGQLEIHSLSQPVKFDGTINVVGPARIVGSFSTIISRTDFGLNIPSVRLVASVEELLRLEFDFAAKPT
jgi:polyisoprenoid-binding protein YceI